MKNSKIQCLRMLCASVYASVVALSAPELLASNTIEVPAPLNAVFTPKGFDDNDNVEIIVTGALPNSCYKMGSTSVSVDQESKQIDIKVTSYFTPNSYCLMLYVPFTKVVSVGVLDAGSYSVSVNKTLKNSIPVALAHNNEADDHLYATVVNLSRKSERLFQLQGILPDACAVLKEVRVIEEEGNVLAILPIVKIEKSCQDPLETLDFTAEFEINPEILGEKLIHVRSLNGASVNQVVTVQN